MEKDCAESIETASSRVMKLPPEQEAIRAKCFHPSEPFIEFPKEDVETSIPARFEKITRMYPERLALKQGNQSWTYEALNKAANRLAWCLTERKRTKTETIALAIGNDCLAIIGCLAALKANKIPVVIDPSLPRERGAYILEDSQAECIISDNANFDYSKSLSVTENRIVSVDAIGGNFNEENLRLPIAPDATAHLVYTSGSTGQTKGVFFNHRRILYDVMEDINAIHTCPGDCVAHFRKLTFSWGIADLLRCILSGATLMPYDVNNEGLINLPSFILDQGITIFRPSVSMFRQLTDRLTGIDPFRQVRLLNLPDAAITVNDVRVYKKLFPDTCVLMHQYNSSEAGVISFYFMDKNTEIEDPVIPVGYPVVGKSVFLVDENGMAVTGDDMGEITVQSRYISSGYWRDSELSEQRFPNQEGYATERLCRTGDLGRFLPDGCLVHVGRKDFVYKIRGYRVSITEIEGALISHPDIADAGVAVWERDAGEKYLAGYVVAALGSNLNVSGIAEYLRNKLPHYMVPSVFVFLDSLPLTNGKLNRGALPRPDKRRPNLAVSYVPPRTEIEKKLCQIWTEVLGVEHIGIRDNFFDLGGQSMLAMRILSAIHDAFRINLSMRNLLDAPTVAALALQLDQLNNLRDEAGAASNQSPCLKPGAKNTLLPLSYAEEGLWLNEQIRPGSSAWNMQSRLRLRGPLDIELLRRSFDTLIERHSILRTSYRSVEGKPQRTVASHFRFELPIIELKASFATEDDIVRICREEELLLFNLEQAPLFRTRLIRVNHQHHILVITKHHIITDAWSSNVFQRELFLLYQAYLKQQPSPLAALTIQYADYALWARDNMREQMGRHLSFWEEKLKGAVLQEIPTEKRRPLERSYRGEREHIQLSQQDLALLSKLCTDERTTLFMLLVAAFKVLLNRYTGSDDIVVGSAFAGRNRPELEHLLGMFVNILVLRTDLSGQPTFRELLKRVRETCLDAHQHQEMPFEKLVEELNPGRSLTRNPFFQVLFNVAHQSPGVHEIAGLSVEQMRSTEDTARYDISLYTRETDDGLEIAVGYNRDVFSRNHIVETMGQYKYLIEQIAANPDQQCGQYSLVTLSAKNILPNPRMFLDDLWQGSIPEVISAYVQRHPDKIALEDPCGAWSYHELSGRSNQLANCLLKHDIQRGDIVAVRGRRSATLVCALLGVLKAGAAFCVIDPSHPKKRVKEYLSTTKCAAIVEISNDDDSKLDPELVFSEKELKCRIDLHHEVNEKGCKSISQYSDEDPQVTLGPNDLAYIIFTSGSTGKPKGVMGRHGPLTHFVPWIADTFGVSEDDHFSFLSSLSTNKLQREIFTALCQGASLYIPSDDDIGSVGKLDDWLRRKAISVIHLTPAMATLLKETAHGAIPSVKIVFFGGDLLHIRDVENSRKLMPNAKIINFYNSSETQRGGGYYICPETRLDHAKDIPPLGKGVKDVQLLIMNPSGNLAGVGEQGEICVRSPHLAGGYFGDEKLTQQRFITNPFTGISDDRIYRTGELGRYMPDGNVEFIARAENQVSIRGFRVELGEVEAVLQEHPAVKQTVALAQELGPGNNRVIAYFVADPKSQPMTADFRTFLKQKLPDYMVPSTFVMLDALPLTPTGKIDRKALPIPEQGQRELENRYVSPRNEVEKTIAAIWANVLKLDKVGIDDNFFDLGGHSLLAIQVMSRVCLEFKIEIPLRTLFEHPTVAELAERIAPGQGSSTVQEEIEVLLAELDSLSDEEANRIIGEKRNEMPDK